MRGMVLIATVVCAVAILLGVVAQPGDTREGSDSRTIVSSNVNAPTPTTTPTWTGLTQQVTAPTSTATFPPDPTPLPPTHTPESSPTATAPVAALPLVAQPALAAPTIGNVYAYYSELHTHDIFTVAWRPGAFPPEKAQQIAAQARQSLETVNRLLGTSDYEPIAIYLADQLFDEQCIGCQGFAAADFRQVFLLQDGSVSDDELPALLTHEIGHVVAGTAIALPENLFFAEGLAVWLSDADIRASGYVSPLQTAAWALEAGALPSLETLLQGSYAGRLRNRIEYDCAASFTFFVIDTYGQDVYRQMYVQSRYNANLSPDVVGMDWATLESEWRAYLSQWAGQEVAGADGVAWWQVAERISAGFRRLYDDPAHVSSDQYAALTQARLELNRVHLDQAVALADMSNLTAGQAN